MSGTRAPPLSGDGSACPPSGVPGLSPRQVRDALTANGWGSLPVMEHDAPTKGAGKRPTLKKWERFATFDGPLPTAIELAGWARSPSQGPGTGIPCGAVVGIDIDVSDPKLVAEIAYMAWDCFGATPFVRQGSAPKVCMIYRAAEPIPKRNLKANDGSGDGLDVIGESAHFVAFGIHPRTCRPYQWLGDETPLTAPPQSAPEITAAQIEAFVDRVRGVLPLTKTGGRTGGPGGASAEIVRDAEGFVRDGREAHLTRLVWRAVTALHAADRPLVEAAVVASAWPEFVRTARVEVDGRRWTDADCAAKARGTLDRIRRGLVELPPKQVGAVEATYRDDAVPLAEAEAEVARRVRHFFEREVPAFRRDQTFYEFKHATNPFALPPQPRAVALRIEAGIGKTEAAIHAAAAAVRRGQAIVYAVPTVELGDAVAARFAAIGIAARVWRGREQADPYALGENMCRDLQAVADAWRAGAYRVTSAVCSKKKSGGEPLRCRFHGVCGHIRQQGTEPPIWIVAHVMLFRGRSAAIPTPDALVIDESFHGKALPDRPAVLAVDAIERAGLPDATATDQALRPARHALVDALRRAPDGPLSRADLVAVGVTAEMARSAKAYEWERYEEPGIVPGQPSQERGGRADAVASVNAEVKSLAGLWAEVADFLEGDFALSGRLVVAQDDRGARVMRRRSVRTMHDSWRCPTLILDATAPPADVLTIALGMPVDVAAVIRARWSEAGRVRQIIGAAVTSNKLGANGQGGGERSLAELARFVAFRAAMAYPAKIGVVLQKNLVGRFEAHELGSNVEVRNFGALAGLDHWREFGGVILIGRTAPPPGSMEADAGVLTGQPIEHTADARSTGGVLLRDGSTVAVSTIRLSDPIAEALRWQVCEGNLIQALGRIRPLRLGARRGFFVDVLCDVPLPIVVDQVEQWEAAKPGPWARMAAGGVVFTSAADVAAGRPDLAGTEKTARCIVEGATSALTSKEGVSLDVRADVRHVRRGRIKRRGRFAPTEIVLLPNAPQGYAELRLGPLRALGRLSLEVEGEPPRPCPIEQAWKQHGPRLPRPSALERIGAAVRRQAEAMSSMIAAAAAVDDVEDAEGASE